ECGRHPCGGALVATRPYLSIGEVLTLLKDEFPDITISKIRFLESQGLLDPERTPSGYRKFYESDVARLRWILRQQREHFLPLKVIKGRLGRDDGVPLREEAEARAAAPLAAVEALPEPDDAEPAAFGPSGASLTVDELASACGLEAHQVEELERYGLVAGQSPVGGTVYYAEDALLMARIAAGFMKLGVEPRHLRMYKTAAEREVTFFEQLVMPLLKQRNPQA